MTADLLGHVGRGEPGSGHGRHLALVFRCPPLRGLSSKDAPGRLDTYVRVAEDGVQQPDHLLDKFGPVLVVRRVGAVREHPRIARAQKDVGIQSDPDLPLNGLLVGQVFAERQVPLLVRGAERKGWVHELVAQFSSEEDLEHVPGAARFALLPTWYAASVQAVLGRQCDDVLRQLLDLGLRHAHGSQQLLKDPRERAHTVACQEDGLRGRLAVRCQQRGCRAEAHGLKSGIVVLIFPLRELLQHSGSGRDVLEAVGQNPGQASKLSLKAEEHRADNSLHLVQERSSRVAVIKHDPLATELRLILQHFVEAHSAVGVLAHDRAVVAFSFSAGHSAFCLLRRDVRGIQPKLELHARCCASMSVRIFGGQQDIGVCVVFTLGVAEHFGAANGCSLDFSRGAAVGIHLSHNVEVEDVEAVVAFVEAQLLRL
mmetsp:Transcript_56402/g.182752  ORF Transcript_56402/g.182752 Transcript_56402/m.182752 type:complete len:427 (-) Transcript_56402:460-1740(-)